MTDCEPPLVDAGEVGEPRRDATVHGVVLAAGRSERFGPENKLLATVDGEPLVRRATRLLVDGATDGVTVVVGHEADRVGEAVAGLDATVRRNPDYDRGQSTSVREGVRAVREREREGHQTIDAVVFGLGDMPDVSPTTVDALVAAYEAGDGDAIAAAYRGQRGNPVLFDRQYFGALSDVSGDTGGREILRSAESAIRLDVDDPGVVADVDRSEELGERG